MKKNRLYYIKLNEMTRLQINKHKTATRPKMQFAILGVQFDKKKHCGLTDFFIFDGKHKKIWGSSTTHKKYNVKNLLKFFIRGVMIKFYHNFSFFFLDLPPHEVFFLLGILSFFAKLNPIIKESKLIFLRVKYKRMSFFFKDLTTTIPKDCFLRHANNKLLKTVTLKKIRQNNQKLIYFKNITTQYVIALKIFIYTYFWYKINFKNIFSISDLALRIFYLNFCSPENKTVLNTKMKETFVRHSYFGGFQTTFSPTAKVAFAYDINSQYPSAMLKKMPVGQGKWFRPRGPVNVREIFGFYEVFISKKNLNGGAELPCKFHGYSGPIAGSWRGIYFSAEIKKAVAANYNLRIVKILRFKKKYFFKDFVTHLFTVKEQARNLSLIFFFSKVLLVSLYGRFGMRHTRESSKLIKTQKELNFFLKRFKINYIDFVSRQNVLIRYINVPNLKICQKNGISVRDFLRNSGNIFRMNNAAVQLPAAITSYARSSILKYLDFSGHNLIFTNTDSFFLNYPLKVSSAVKKIGLARQIKKNWVLKNCHFNHGRSYSYLESWSNLFLRLKIQFWAWDKNELNLTTFKTSLNFFLFWQKPKLRVQTNFFLKRKKIHYFMGRRQWVKTKPLTIINESAEYAKIKKF